MYILSGALKIQPAECLPWKMDYLGKETRYENPAIA
jgi:hypothetical protein